MEQKMEISPQNIPKSEYHTSVGIQEYQKLPWGGGPIYLNLKNTNVSVFVSAHH